MNFVDNTGHLFSLPSFTFNPIGYEFTENRHIFWLENQNCAFLSLGNYYIKPIYFYSPYPIKYMRVTSQSETYALVGSRIAQMSFIKNQMIDITDDDIRYILEYDYEAEELNDILEVPITTNNEKTECKGFMYPFYVIGHSWQSGTILSNFLIHVIWDEDGYIDLEAYCPITVGGEWAEENEIINVNARNMGVNLPIDILRAVYEASFINGEFDETLYNQKVKEYMLNYMNIRGEVGNYRSAIDSLKWFGWGNHISLVSLFETDNQVLTQFVRDYFDVNTDMLESFRTFRNSTLLSLIVPDNTEIKDDNGNIIYDPYNLDNEFFGENQPMLEDLFKKYIPVEYGGRGEESIYWKPYYNFVFGELALKLSALKHFYEQNFLPVHLSVHNASIHHKVYANDIKQLARADVAITEHIIDNCSSTVDLVKFPESHILWLTEQTHIVDSQYNEWENTDINLGDYYYIHDTCLNIPIKFLVDENKIANVVMILEKESFDRNKYQLYINHPIDIYNDDITVYNIINETVDISKFPCAFSTDNGKTYSIWFDNLKYLKDYIKSEMSISFDINAEMNVLSGIGNGRLDLSKYIIRSATPDIFGNWVIVNDIMITDKDQYFKIYDLDDNYLGHLLVPHRDAANINMLPNENGEYLGNVNCTIYKDVYLKFKYNRNKLYNIFINNKSIKDNTFIEYFPTTNVVYESHFTFDPSQDTYQDLVIYPKMLSTVNTDTKNNRHIYTENEINISYWIGSNFVLRVLVNNIWHEYKFTVKIPDIQFDMGTLTYRYYDDELKLTTKFNQLSKLEKDGDNIDVEFNAFMHEPELTQINHINFFEDFIKYLKITDAHYITGDVIPDNVFYSYIDVEDKNGHKQRIYFNTELIGKDLIIPKRYFENDIIYYLYYRNEIFVFSHYMYSDENIYVVDYDIPIIGGDELRDPNKITFYNSEFALSLDSNENSDQYIDINDYKKFYWDPETERYYIDILDERIWFNVMTSLKTSFDDFTSHYIEQHSITNSDKYKNQLHLYDIYRLNDHIGDNKLFIHNNIDFKYHGIRFTHDNYLDPTKLLIHGNYDDLIDDVNLRSYDNTLFNTELSDEIGSYINTFDDLTIYSAYNRDHIIPNAITKTPSGYLYYDKVDLNGYTTGEYSGDPISLLTYNVPLYYIDEYESNSYMYETQYFSNMYNALSYDWHIDNIYSHIYTNSETSREFPWGSSYIITDNRTGAQTQVKLNIKLWDITKQEYINPTHKKFIEDICKNNDYNELQSNYRYRLFAYAVNGILSHNVEHIFTGDYNIVDDEAWAIIEGQNVKLYPYYDNLDGEIDDLLADEEEILENQPGYDWINIDDSLLYFNQYMEVLNFDELESALNNEEFEVNTYMGDIETMTRWRNYLKMDITKKILSDIAQFSDTANEEGLMHYEIINDKIDEGFLTVVKIETNDEEHNSVTNYYTDSFDVNIDIAYMPTDVTVFFAIDKSKITPDDNNIFDIEAHPEIRRKYKDYDILEFNTDDYIDPEYAVTFNINNKDVVYGDLSQSSKKLYADFFISNEEKINEERKITHVDCIPELNIDRGVVEYDMYLMHDKQQWYIVYISKDTCDKNITLYDFNPSKDEMMLETDNAKYKIKLFASGKRFLLNRYEYKSKNGKNRFDTRDIIATRIINNQRLPIDVTMSNKWEITPGSLGMKPDKIISTSNTQMCIIDAPTINNEYYPGYYEIMYRYNIDRNAIHQYYLSGAFRVMKNKNKPL